MHQFELKLNGPLAVIDNQPRNITPTSEKGKALILLLATAGKQGRSRPWLQSILWPGASSAANLRNELSVLRRHFGQFGQSPIKSNKKMIYWNEEICSVDSSQRSDDQRKLELAEGLDVDVPEFNEWLSQERNYWAKSKGEESETRGMKDTNSTFSSRKGVPLLFVEEIESDLLSEKQQLLAFGLREELLTSLGALIGVIEVTMFEPKKKNLNSYKVQISVRKDCQLRVTARLIGLFSNRILWTGRFEVGEHGDFDVQERIARNVIEVFQERLTDGAWAQIWRQKQIQIAAWEAFQRGRLLEANFDLQSNEAAILEYERVFKLEPEFHAAITAKGFCLADQIRLGWSTDTDSALEEINNIVESVLEVEPEDFYALSLEAFSVFLAGDKDEGLQLLERVVLSNPFSPEATAYYGAMLGYMGETEEEISKYKLSLAMTSHPPTWIISNLAIAQVTIDDLEGGTTADLALLRSPRSVRARIAKVCSLVNQNKIQEAQEFANEILEIEPSFQATTWSSRNCFLDSRDFEGIEHRLRAVGL